MARYVLLVRHGQYEEDGVRRSRRKLTSAGRQETREVADSLARHLVIHRDDIQISAIVRSPADESKETCRIFEDAIGLAAHDVILPKTTECNRLDPDSAQESDFRKITPKEQAEELTDYILHLAKNGGAVLVVGHQPYLSWIATVLCGEGHPVSRSELLCIQLENYKSGVLRWVLSPTPTDADVKELKEKIQSKMEVAKVLGGIITAGLGFFLGALVKGDLDGQLWALWLATVFLFVALVLYLATMYSYDTLLMPKRFWKQEPIGPAEQPRWLVARPLRKSGFSNRI